jgi:hypothetical protein
MGTDRVFVYGPAYLDVVVETPLPLAGVLLDQSVPAVSALPRDDGRLVVVGPTGDALTFPDAGDAALTVTLAEPILARLHGVETPETVTGIYPVAAVRTQLGGMGAGYALALDGTLRCPLGDDAVGRAVQTQLADAGVALAPCRVDCPSDSSLVILSARGDKLAIGVRRAMVEWTIVDDDTALLADADALVCCGAPNALVAALRAHRPGVPVLCAPAMRNVSDPDVPLASLDGISVLTLNALEWAHLADRDALRARVPVIAVTDGPRGSTLYVDGAAIAIPAEPRTTPANTNRAGETYGATLFSVLRRLCPDFRVSRAAAAFAGRLAARQAARQLDITGFAFPPRNWEAEVAAWRA